MQSLRDLIAAQQGVLARHQAIAAGVSRHRWAWAISSGRAQQVLRGVAVLHSGEPTEQELLWACVLYGGPKARLSGDAALVAWGLKLRELGGVDLVVPHARQVRATALPDRRQVRAHRVRRLECLASPVVGLPRVSAHAATLQAAAWAPSDRVAENRITSMVQQRRTAVPQLRSALAQLPQLARRGLVRTVLDEVEHGVHASSELDFRRFLHRHGLPLPDRLQVKVRAVGTRYLDARYDRLRLSFELDGRHHMLVEQWEADTLRSLEIVAALDGERVVRLTPGLLRHEEERVAAALRRLLLPGG